MVDNVTFQSDTPATPPAGFVPATDNIAGVHYQRVKVTFGDDGFATDASTANPLPVTLISSALPTGAATEATLAGVLTIADFDTKTGALTETAPTTDTASSGLNGRLQRIAQRLTTLLGVFPTTIDTNSGVKSASTLRVVLATDQPALTNKLLVTPDANSAVNVAQINGVTATMGNGVSGTGVLRVTLASDSTGTVAATQSGNWTARVVGNAGATVDATVGAGTAPTNMLAVGGQYNSTEPSPTTGQSLAVQLDSKGRQRTVLMDAAGNTRGANIDASNRLSVTVDNVSATNISTNIAQMNGVAVTMGNGASGTGVQRVTLASDSTGTVAATQSGTWTVQPGNTANTTPWLIQDTPATSGGLSFSWNSIKATATSIKASAGQVYGWYIYNSNSSVAYVQFFNTLNGSVTLGTTVPVYSLGIPATSGANVMIPHGIAHSTAIVVAATTTATGLTAPTNNVDINVFYK